MKLGIISFTENGSLRNQRLCKNLNQIGIESVGYSLERYAVRFGLNSLSSSLSDWVQQAFNTYDAILFISACGIAVRGIAPYIKDKFKDPAVLVMDEQGQFVISLLSGHVGGANELAKIVAEQMDAIPVISTATDLNRRFAVDLFAKKNNLAISDRSLAKEISAVLLDGGSIGFASDFEWKGSLPDGIVAVKNDIVLSTAEVKKLGFYISLNHGRALFEKTLYLTPSLIILGIGCRKGISAVVIEEMVTKQLKEIGIVTDALDMVASIDLKREETGLLEFCSKYKLKFQTYSAMELAKVQGDFTKSEFVSSITGVDNVCERAAVLASDGGALILNKTAENGVTVAASIKKWSVCFA